MIHHFLLILYLMIYVYILCRDVLKNLNRATAEAVAAPKTKRDRVAELHYITRGARNVKDRNFEVS